MPKISEIDWPRILYFVLIATISIFVGVYAQPLIHGNEKAVGVIVNVFSILAGFLITIMTILGEPRASKGSSWRLESLKKKNFYRRLVRNKWLFKIYLVILGLVFISSLISNKHPDHSSVEQLEIIYLSLSVFAFSWSITLPSRLMSIQLDRFDEMVNDKKNNGTEKPKE